MFPERDYLLSGQKSSTSSQLLYDGLPSFLSSASLSMLRPIQLSKYKWKKRCFVCSTLVTLVYISEYSYGRSVTYTLWACLVPCGECPLRHGLVSYYRNLEWIQTANSVKAWFSPSSLEMAHSFGDPLLSRSSVCSLFRPVSDISAHCSHLWGSSHLGSTRTLVPLAALPAL
ncbi:hypothetical protein IHE45_18G050900 [Dioscorea alata]|uniref:Uncharacterized protein n=1 Tax=Dioscorea alata TaxID=55571 RepID=A0ACB7U6S8_DIOAL|nr:hypothetical protein IHE45_18G050900 [Dioscorea alata]